MHKVNSNEKLDNKGELMLKTNRLVNIDLVDFQFSFQVARESDGSYFSYDKNRFGSCWLNPVIFVSLQHYQFVQYKTIAYSL